MILVVGDVMLDRYVHGDVTRLSPEAPVPVLRKRRDELALGGAANVAANIHAMGAEVMLLGVIGRDVTAKKLISLIEFDHRLVHDEGRVTTCKERCIAHGQQLLRVDDESLEPLSTLIEERLMRRFEVAMEPLPSVIVLSDYAKGTLTDRVISHVIETAKAENVPVIVDPKRDDFTIYHGATVLTPNAAEASRASGVRVVDDATAEKAAAALRWPYDAIIITRGGAGYTLSKYRGRTVHRRPATAREVDVTGAGDTFVAALAVRVSRGDAVEVAAERANVAAGVAVTRRGTAVVSWVDVVAVVSAEAVSHVDKIWPLNLVQLAAERDGWRIAGCSVGVTNGCFDLLHDGHRHLLAEARKLCDRLIVAVNSDGSVARLKGASRPVQGLTTRMRALSSCEDVDAVVAFEEDTPLDLIRTLKPDLLFKGADYRLDEVVGRNEVATTVLIPLLPGHSTTARVQGEAA